MFLYVYRRMVCNFLLDNADRVCRIYKPGGVAKKQPADCYYYYYYYLRGALPLGLHSLCEQGKVRNKTNNRRKQKQII
nr:hypothetical protein Q903MT_gene5245 [Picea sitchensis]